MSDGTGGETVVYQYDGLKRLISAVATPNSGSTPTAWSETYGYDGFGNLTSKSLNGAAGTIAVDAATNRLDVQSIRYDANGNLYAGTGGLAMTYDESNRLASARPGGGINPVEYYGYAPDNKRVLRVKSNGTEEWTMYGARGEKLGVYTLSPLTAIYESHGYYVGQQAWFTAVSTNIWFDGRLVAEGVTAALPAGSPVYQDRLGTNRASGARFYPYGEEMGGPNATANDRVKFGTYTRDGFSGLDYADQRYYAAVDGRFSTADPYRASAGAGDPGSWNRYAYVVGDPVNMYDPEGLAAYPAGYCDASMSAADCFGGDPIRGGSPGLTCDTGNPSVATLGCIAATVTPPWLIGSPDYPAPSGGTGDSLLDRSKSSARNALGNRNCYTYFGFSSAKDAQNAFDGVRFNEASYGKLKLVNGSPSTDRNDPVAATTVGYGTVNINTDYNWADFSKNPTQAGSTYNFLAYFNRNLGTAFDSEQLGTFIILHELGHMNTWPKQRSDAETWAERISLAANCMR